MAHEVGFSNYRFARVWWWVFSSPQMLYTPIILCVFGCVTFLAYRYLSRKPADLSDDLILITGNLLSIAYRGCQALQMGLVGF